MHNRRRLTRIASKCLLLVSLPMAGFLWAFAHDPRMSIYAGLLTIVSISAALVAETLATHAEDGVVHLERGLRDHKADRDQELARKNHQIHNMEVIIGIMEKENHDLRAKLITTMARQHRDHDHHVDGKKS